MIIGSSNGDIEFDNPDDVAAIIKEVCKGQDLSALSVETKRQIFELLKSLSDSSLLQQLLKDLAYHNPETWQPCLERMKITPGWLLKNLKQEAAASSYPYQIIRSYDDSLCVQWGDGLDSLIWIADEQSSERREKIDLGCSDIAQILFNIYGTQLLVRTKSGAVYQHTLIGGNNELLEERDVLAIAQGKRANIVALGKSQEVSLFDLDRQICESFSIACMNEQNSLCSLAFSPDDRYIAILFAVKTVVYDRFYQKVVFDTPVCVKSIHWPDEHSGIVGYSEHDGDCMYQLIKIPSEKEAFSSWLGG